jgi:hypothetical protein
VRIRHPNRLVVGGHLEQRPHVVGNRRQCLAAWHFRSERLEGQQHEIMVGRNMCPLVREHSGQLIGRKDVDRAATEDNPPMTTRQAVGGSARMVDDEGVWDLAVLLGDEIEQLTVVGACSPQTDRTGQ